MRIRFLRHVAFEMAPAVIADCRARCRRIRPVLHAVLDRLAAAGTENVE